MFNTFHSCMQEGEERRESSTKEGEEEKKEEECAMHFSSLLIWEDANANHSCKE